MDVCDPGAGDHSASPARLQQRALGGKVIAANMWGKVKPRCKCSPFVLLLWLRGGGRVFRGTRGAAFATQVISYVLCCGGGLPAAHFRGKHSQPAFHQYGVIIMRGGMPPAPSKAAAREDPCGFALMERSG